MTEETRRTDRAGRRGAARTTTGARRGWVRRDARPVARSHVARAAGQKQREHPNQ